jgi:uncharacterized repeat protein (TIGR03837 family)
MPSDPRATWLHPVTWDVFCRVVDNHGDAGVGWRLATDLASRGVHVRLWIDDPRALAWMAPAGRTGVDVLPWPMTDADVAMAISDPAVVVIEAFGCALPEPYLRLMASAPAGSPAPLWINLEYLSAEPYVERSHRLPSPQASGTGRGLTSHFFYPGFTERTGGLLRETDLMSRQAAFDGQRWLADHAIAPRPGERVVSLFCYDNPNLAELLRALAHQPTLLLTTPGHATEQVARAMAGADTSGALRTQALPWLTQIDYDHLLWSCDLNFVRGEDSLVRAIWAARPFAWQIYPQSDAAHLTKLDAFLSLALAGLPRPAAAAVRAACWRWNTAPTGHPTGANDDWSVLNSAAQMSAWGQRCAAWRDTLLKQADLVTQLMTFQAALQPAKEAKI